MQKGAAVFLLQQELVRKGTIVRVRRELRHIFPEFECYIMMIAFIITVGEIM